MLWVFDIVEKTFALFTTGVILEDTITDWISAVSSLVGACGIALLWWQLVLQKRQTAFDHERSRRERTIELFLKWNEFERTEGHLALALAEDFDTTISRAIWAGESTSVHKSRKGTLERFLSRQGDKHDLEIDNENVIITSECSLELRSRIVECMNLLETIFSAGRHGVADQEMIDEQFACLIEPDPTRRKTMMKVIREVAGGAAAYPSTTEFDRVVIQRKQTAAPGKKTLG